VRHKLDGSKQADVSEINRLQRRPLAKPLQWYEENVADRKQAMALAYASGDYTMKEISEWFCVHYSTVSRAVKLFEENA
jgi:DNA-binding MarR family transcriptional regulator